MIGIQPELQARRLRSQDSPALAFDEKTHTYTFRGRRLISVTQLLSAFRLIDDRWFTERSRERGRIVHTLTQLWDDDDLDYDQVDPRLKGYLDAWIAFRAGTGFEPIWIEQRLCDPNFFLAGTLDRLGVAPDGRILLVDLKSGVYQPWHDLQLGLYHHLAIVNDLVKASDPVEAVSLGLRADGRFDPKPLQLTLAEARTAGLSLAFIHNHFEFTKRGL